LNIAAFFRHFPPFLLHADFATPLIRHALRLRIFSFSLIFRLTPSRLIDSLRDYFCRFSLITLMLRRDYFRRRRHLRARYRQRFRYYAGLPPFSRRRCRTRATRVDASDAAGAFRRCFSDALPRMPLSRLPPRRRLIVCRCQRRTPERFAAIAAADADATTPISRCPPLPPHAESPLPRRSVSLMPLHYFRFDA
jgi:hypothetical protein